jgi:hypothetical protein
VDDVDSPSVNKYEKNASSPNKHVLHNKYIWSRVRRNIDVMLCRSQPDAQYAPIREFESHCSNLYGS